MTPGAGNSNSWAWTQGMGPNVLAKKAKISPGAIIPLRFKFFLIWKVYTTLLNNANFWECASRQNYRLLAKLI